MVSDSVLNALKAINNLDLYPLSDRETNIFYEKSDGLSVHMSGEFIISEN